MEGVGRSICLIWKWINDICDYFEYLDFPQLFQVVSRYSQCQHALHDRDLANIPMERLWWFRRYYLLDECDYVG